MTDRTGWRQQVIEEMGLGPVWTRRAQPEAGSVSTQPEAEVTSPSLQSEPASINLEAPPAAPPASDVARMDWAALETAVAGCVKCRLCEGRTKTVFGVGDRKAKWLFIGEGPGRNEDLQGLPFVGPAGKLLDNMLVAMGLSRTENAFIANVVKCRPTGDDGRDRPPAPDEIAACMPYLQRQIELIQRRGVAARSAGRKPGWQTARPGLRIPRPAAGRHLPSGLSAAPPDRQGQVLGRPVPGDECLCRQALTT
jgi:hypothetical protein